MTSIDDRIKDALNAQDREMMGRLDEQGPIGQFTGLFKGKAAGLTIIVIIASLFFVVIGFYAAWRAYSTTEIHSVLMWGGLAWFFLMAQMMVKMWSWMRMETNRTIREIKRVELQLARLLEGTIGSD